MDLCLNEFDLYDLLHGCRDKRGTGTARIEAKLAQQLAHLEQAPFYGVFLDLKKALDLMDWERCLLILEGYGVRPRMIRLIRNQWWWEQQMCLEAIDATGSNANDGQSNAPAPADAQGRKIAWSQRNTMISVEDGFPESCQLNLVSAGEEWGGCFAATAAKLLYGSFAATWVDSNGGSVTLRCF
jgi:hypothetical protein